MITASSLCLTTNDIILVYFPIPCLNRGIDPSTMGLLLTLRSGMAMLSRAFFVQLIARVGHERTLLAAMLLASVAILPLAIGAPVIAIALAMCLSGFGLGVAVTASRYLTLASAPVEARARDVVAADRQPHQAVRDSGPLGNFSHSCRDRKCVHRHEWDARRIGRSVWLS